MVLGLSNWLNSLSQSIHDTLITDEQPLVFENIILRLRRSKNAITKHIDVLTAPKLLNRFLETNRLIGIHDPHFQAPTEGSIDPAQQHELDLNTAAMHSLIIQLGKDLNLHLSGCADKLHIMSVNFNLCVNTPQLSQRVKDMEHLIPQLCTRLLDDLHGSSERTQSMIADLKLEAKHEQELAEFFIEMSAEFNLLKTDLDAEVRVICTALTRLTR